MAGVLSIDRGPEKLEIRIEYEHFDPRDKDGIEKKVETSRTFLS